MEPASDQRLRRSRFWPGREKIDIRNNDRAIGTLKAFNHHRILPFNGLHELVRIGSYDGHRKQCTRMVRAGLLDRRTFNGTKNTSETMTYWRTEAGEKYLRAKGHTVYSDYNTAQDDEQLLIDLVDAALTIRARDAGVEFHPWHDIINHPLTPPLPKKPFRFDLSDTYLVPDGLPFYLKRAGRSALFLKEVVRTNKGKTALKQKIRQYRVLERQIKDRYGFSSLMIIFIATTKTDEENILTWIAEEFGRAQWMLTQRMRDPIAEYLTTAPIPYQLFDEPWNRAWETRFSLKTLSET